MKQQRPAAEQAVSLAFSLSLGAAAHSSNKKSRRATSPASSGEFVCRTCGRSFPTFQALGGHRTSHLRGRHGLALGIACTEPAPPKKTENGYRCHVCGLEFEIGQALGGHMRRHRDEAAAVAPPVLLQLFV